jgi:hypothetical protein
LHVQLKAHAALEAVRQAGDDASDGDVAAFIGKLQRIGQRQVGRCGCPAQAAQEACRDRPLDAAQEKCRQECCHGAGQQHRP